MKAALERNWMARTVKVWLYEPDGIAGTARLVRLREDGQAREWVDVPAAEKLPEPTFELSESEAEALADALSDITPPSRAVSEHLKDAVAVRDRLLAIVEADS